MPLGEVTVDFEVGSPKVDLCAIEKLRRGGLACPGGTTLLGVAKEPRKRQRLVSGGIESRGGVGLPRAAFDRSSERLSMMSLNEILTCMPVSATRVRLAAVLELPGFRRETGGSRLRGTAAMDPPPRGSKGQGRRRQPGSRQRRRWRAGMQSC